MNALFSHHQDSQRAAVSPEVPPLLILLSTTSENRIVLQLPFNVKATARGKAPVPSRYARAFPEEDVICG